MYHVSVPLVAEQLLATYNGLDDPVRVILRLQGVSSEWRVGVRRFFRTNEGRALLLDSRISVPFGTPITGCGETIDEWLAVRCEQCIRGCPFAVCYRATSTRPAKRRRTKTPHCPHDDQWHQQLHDDLWDEIYRFRAGNRELVRFTVDELNRVGHVVWKRFGYDSDVPRSVGILLAEIAK
jgi:hypothetical protein